MGSGYGRVGWHWERVCTTIGKKGLQLDPRLSHGIET